MKKRIAFVLALAAMFMLSAFTGAVAEGQVTLAYPENMQEKGYTLPLVLEEMPSRVVVMTSTPVLTLYELGVDMIAIPTTSVVRWPGDLAASATMLNTAMNANFDIETVIALDPDLVMMGYTSEETYGQIVTDAGIPVYYLDAGHTVSYDSIKQQTQVLIEAFGANSEAGQAILDRFAALEERLAATREALAGTSAMVLQSSPPDHYIQTDGGTLGSMAAMLGLTNVYENNEASMVLIDYENAISYDPDLVLAVGRSATGEEHQALMEADFANNEAYWQSIGAIADGKILYLPVDYVSSAGIHVMNTIDALVDAVTAKLAE